MAREHHPRPCLLSRGSAAACSMRASQACTNSVCMRGQRPSRGHGSAAHLQLLPSSGVQHVCQQPGIDQGVLSPADQHRAAVAPRQARHRLWGQPREGKGGAGPSRWHSQRLANLRCPATRPRPMGRAASGWQKGPCCCALGGRLRTHCSGMPRQRNRGKQPAGRRLAPHCRPAALPGVPHLIVSRPGLQQAARRGFPHKGRPRGAARGAPRAVWRRRNARQLLGGKAAQVRLVLVPCPKVQTSAAAQLCCHQVVSPKAGQAARWAGAGLEGGEQGARVKVPESRRGRAWQQRRRR